jgi:hypothetical protein
MTFATGFPYDISYNGGTSKSLWCDAVTGFYVCPDSPNQIAPLVRLNPRLRNGSGFGPWFDGTIGDSFVNETIGSFGTTARNPYHGPGINNTNAIIAKNFSLGANRSRYLQIRMESDNVFNHTQFGNPSGNYTSGLFGQITGAANARQTQLATKVVF